VESRTEGSRCGRTNRGDRHAMTRLYGADAELYDIAFDWDVEEEVDWLVERLRTPQSVVEPGCGSGRMLDAFARRGVEVVGLDLSPEMVELARARLGEHAEVIEADMTDFDLGRTFGGAISPINTLLHLTPEQLARHLDCMVRHLDREARYLVQVGLIDRASHDPFAGSHWEETRGETTLHIDWEDEGIDWERGRSRQRSRIEVLAGPRAGEVIEEVHEMTAWTPETWAEAIAASPFTEVATYDAGKKGARPRVDPTATGGLLWHELVPKE
jgi:SAM-dependent methyltransferase